MNSKPHPPTWKNSLQGVFHKRVITLFVYGLSAGLPYALIFSTLSLWLKEAGVERSAITYFSWAALGYSFKFVWSPLVDTLPLPFLKKALGQRRSWLLVSQMAVAFSLVCMASIDPAHSLKYMAIFAVMLGFTAATQDIAVDAYRIESAGKELQVMMSSAYLVGYRTAMIISGAGSLFLASFFGSKAGSYNVSAWQYTYLIMAALMSIGLITTLVIQEPERNIKLDAQKYPYNSSDYARFFLVFLLSVVAFIGVFYFSSDWASALKTTWKAQLNEASLSKGNYRFYLTGVETARIICATLLAVVVGRLSVNIGIANKQLIHQAYFDPVRDFFRRYGMSISILLLAFIGLYRISDIVMGVVANLFYSDIGFTKAQIGAASKTFGLLMTAVGGFLGGVLSIQFGVIRILWLGAILSASTNLLFAWLATSPADMWKLYAVISADNLSGGMATAAFIAFLSALVNIKFTAVQYALFSSLMTFLPKLLGGYSGAISKSMGYSDFFIMTACLGIPVLILIALIQKYIKLD